MKKDNEYIWIFLHLAKTGGTTFNGHMRKYLRWDEEFIHLGSWGREYRKRNNRLDWHKRSVEERNKAIVLGGHRTYYGIHNLVPAKKPRYITFVRCPAERLVSKYNFQMSAQANPMSFDEWYKKEIKNQMVDFFYRKSKGDGEQTLKGRLIGALLTVGERLRAMKKSVEFVQNLPLIGKSHDEKVQKRKLGIAKKILEMCFFVGITRQLDSDLKWLYAEMGVPTEITRYRVTGSSGSMKDIGHPDTRVLKKLFKLDEETKKRIYEENPWDVELYEYARKLAEKRK